MTTKKFHTFVYLLTKKVVSMIIENEGISELDAIQDFYQSDTYQLLEVEDTKYWWGFHLRLYMRSMWIVKGGMLVSKQSEFFILLIETYAHYRNIKGSEVLQMFRQNDLITYIQDMYLQYHTETLQNAFDDLDEQLGLPSKVRLEGVRDNEVIIHG